MNLSKSKYCNAIQCKKMLWMLTNKPESATEASNDAVLDNGNYVHEVARDILGEHTNIDFNPNLKVMLADTKDLIETHKNIVITEATFTYGNNLCSIDILEKIGDKYNIYEVKGSTSMKDIFVSDVSYQYYVLKSLGYDVDKVFVVHLNSDYVRHGDLDLNQLFTKEDVTVDVQELFDDVRKNIEDINKYMEQTDEPDDDIDTKCFKPYDCPFFAYCTRDLPVPNVFDVRRMNKSAKIKMYKKGAYSFPDLLHEHLDDKFRQQIEYELNDLPDYINPDKIQEFLDTLSYPLYFLDFETYQSPIPQFDGTKAYMQIPFQYSLHYYETEGGELKHKEFLSESGIDPRRGLAESLVNDIPMDVTTLAYNMMFEKTVIKNLAEMYPDLSEHLLNIRDNIKDQMIPFKDRQYYNRAMKGSYSIKYVLPALFPNDESLNYHNLDLIHNGSEAMNSFANLEKLTPEERAYTRERLLRYCELDTYAMVKIHQKMIDVTK